MNENARNWVAALRSGEYKQAKHLLRTTTRNGEVKHCCLGVLCEDLSKRKKLPRGLEWVDGKVQSLKRRMRTTRIHSLGGSSVELDRYQGSVLPDRIRNVVGLTLDQQRELIKMNDRGDGFDAIADKIEEMLGATKTE